MIRFTLDQELSEQLITQIRSACDEAAWLFAASGGDRGYVQVNLDLRWRDAQSALREIHRIWDTIDRPNARIRLLYRSADRAFAHSLAQDAGAQGIRVSAVLRKARH